VSLTKYATANNGGPESVVSYFRVVQCIILRESTLIEFTEIARNLEENYWNYVLLRVKAGAKKQPINTESLISKKKVINLLQIQLSIVLAHLRGTSVDVLEAIIKWRKMKKSSNSIKTKETVSVFWKDMNYLQKMDDDFALICDGFFFIRLWLGFEPNTLLLPPLEPVVPMELKFLKKQSSNLLPYSSTRRTSNKDKDTPSRRLSKDRDAIEALSTSRRMSMKDRDTHSPLRRSSIDRQAPSSPSRR
jgi:hypothetical protein